MTAPLTAPFPWFGGKRRVADLVWERLGNVQQYVEPFFGSGAVLFGRAVEPGAKLRETVNDADGLLVNLWRAIQADPAAVARYCDWPVTELDLAARHRYLVDHRAQIDASLRADPRWYDVELAGWWVWGRSCAIGSTWASRASDFRELPYLNSLSHGGGVHTNTDTLARLHLLAARLRYVRVACGDWSRVCTETPTTSQGRALCGVFLDPPYDGHEDLYHDKARNLSAEVRTWCLERGHEPKLRIALCGYAGEHDELELHGWTVQPWKAKGGYANANLSTGGTNDNAHRERIWFSPHCLSPAQTSLF